MASTPLRRVLAIGVRGQGGWTLEQAMQVISTEKDKASKAGFQFAVHSMQLALPDEEILKELEGVLQREKWEGLALGFGIRGDRERTALFEKLVNLAVTTVRPTPKLAFPTMPDKIVEAFERVFA